MSAERTEEPTPRRLSEARKRGEVVRSRALAGALGSVAAYAAFRADVAGWLAALVVYVRRSVTAAVGAQPLTPDRIAASFSAGLRAWASAIAPVWLATVVVGVAWGMLQTRALLTLQPLKPDLGRVSPKLSRLMSATTAVELLRGLVVVALLAAIVATAARPLVGVLARATGSGAWAVARLLGEGARRLAEPILGATLFVGVADYLWQRRKHHRSLRMTREEVKREHKESEGDPHAKAERERVRREILEHRALAEVRKADFVVVNPDHLAVAVKYDREGEGAPVVVARGERLIAEQIKSIAREAGVPIYRDVPLARALHEVAEGDEIPEALWEAVAEILRAVYGMTPAGGDPAASPVAPTAAAIPARGAEPRSGWRRV